MEEVRLYSFEEVEDSFNKLTMALIRGGVTITLMESCTSGFIASLITDIEGSSSIFKGSFVTYSNEAKIKVGVPSNIIEEKGVYSHETARSMAEVSQAAYLSDLAIGITGSFGNIDPYNKDSIPGIVYFAIDYKDIKESYEIKLPANVTRFQSKLCVAGAIYDKLKDFITI